MHPSVTASLALLFCTGLAFAQAPDPDRDEDGLSDFHELHKYGTDPDRADSDGDGIPDGDWHERREWTYTIRTILQVLPPVTEDVLCDDYQDARFLDRTHEYVELEVIHYPLNTVAEALTSDPNWRAHLEGLEHWLQPGLTSNWDTALASQIKAALLSDNIDADQLSDKDLVEQASRWLCKRAPHNDGFSTFITSFDAEGQAYIAPEHEHVSVKEQKKSGLTLEEQWSQELFAKGMFQSASRGSCTSSAIYLSGCLRALGVPTRTVLTTPLIDASDEREMKSLARLRHPSIRRKIQKGVQRLTNSWASHTFNEVWVGGRWRRLNYDKLGQNTLDSKLFGLLTHVATFHDWSDANMPTTWGRRDSTRGTDGRKDDIFGGTNPYHTVALSDRFGEHSGLSPEELENSELNQLTISDAFWNDDPKSPFRSSSRQPGEAAQDPVILLYVGKHEDFQVIKDFTAQADRRFFLEAPGHPTLKVGTGIGGWSSNDACYVVLGLGPADWAEFVPNTNYNIRPQNNSSTHTWKLAQPFEVQRPAK